MNIPNWKALIKSSSVNSMAMLAGGPSKKDYINPDTGVFDKEAWRAAYYQWKETGELPKGHNPNLPEETAQGGDYDLEANVGKYFDLVQEKNDIIYGRMNGQQVDWEKLPELTAQINELRAELKSHGWTDDRSVRNSASVRDI